MPDPFTFPVDDTNVNVTGNSTWTYNPTDPLQHTEPVDWTFIGVFLGVLFATLLLSYLYYKRTESRKGRDKKASVDKMSVSGWSPNKMMMIQLAVLFPSIFGIMFGITAMLSNMLLGIFIILSVAGVTVGPYFYAKEASRSKNRNKYKLDGYLWKKDGSRMKYSFNNVSFATERLLTGEEIDAICEQNKEWDRSMFERIRMIPMNVDDEYNAYLLMQRPISEAFEWVDDEDFDYYGELPIKVDGPELREIATIIHVKKEEDEEESFINEHVPVLMVLWDAYCGKQSIGKIAPIDITKDEVLTGLTKAIGVDHRHTAGELNHVNEAFVSLQNEDRDFDDLAMSIGRKKALDFLRNQDRITSFNAFLDRINISMVLMIVIGAICIFAGYQWGMNEAIKAFYGGGLP